MPQDPWAAFPVVPGIEGAYEQSVINSPTTAPTAPVISTGVTSAANAPIYQGGTSIDTLGRLGDEPEIAQIQAPAIDNNLAMARGRFAAELQNNPALWNKLMTTTNAEVGGQGQTAQQALIESVFNRATARGMTLDQALSQKKYWDSRTIAAQNKPLPQDAATNLRPIINNAISGSNVSNYATGNGTGPNVVFKSGGEPFVLEENKNDQNWVKGMARIAQQAPTPAPTPTLLQPKLTPTQLLAQYNSIAGKVSPSIYQPVFRPYQPTQAQSLL